MVHFTYAHYALASIQLAFCRLILVVGSDIRVLRPYPATTILVLYITHADAGYIVFHCYDVLFPRPANVSSRVDAWSIVRAHTFCIRFNVRHAAFLPTHRGRLEHWNRDHTRNRILSLQLTRSYSANRCNRTDGDFAADYAGRADDGTAVGTHILKQRLTCSFAIKRLGLAVIHLSCCGIKIAHFLLFAGLASFAEI